jgi:hypothetical protein
VFSFIKFYPAQEPINTFLFSIQVPSIHSFAPNSIPITKSGLFGSNAGFYLLFQRYVKEQDLTGENHIKDGIKKHRHRSNNQKRHYFVNNNEYLC